jgi:hypothetical protein
MTEQRTSTIKNGYALAGALVDAHQAATETANAHPNTKTARTADGRYIGIREAIAIVWGIEQSEVSNLLWAAIRANSTRETRVSDLLDLLDSSAS